MSKGNPPETPSGPKYRLVLFVAGDERNSRIARENLERVCREDLQGHCEVRVVDILEDFEAAIQNNILLTPALQVIEPPIEELIIGNLSDAETVRSVLRIDKTKVIPWKKTAND
jgi:circadian clock protein KaiB